ncbi:hypothetical protein [Paractinoplanes brasiliensis]|uniref:Uncharacterized protein n=1 Tax=Paractinoplanes brasiliensis TaxID=52695 RepID=A0A4R6J985_9ACTN|nr:hypothetical protein [Actinoplanes brasiliensis]TDO32159.1 hypothetical protein C8E87_7605 [Actinoplanes brasiliensis]GID28213.1 hypothetical protein Abr02nite_31960 [Actinoplanes brasiliensis]
MIDILEVRARTALSPEWDHGFDEAFAELVSSDPDLVQAEFDDLIASSWTGPSDVAPPPDPPVAGPESSPSDAAPPPDRPVAGPELSPDTAAPGPVGARPDGDSCGAPAHQRPPPP